MKIPDEHQALMPYLILKDAANFMAFTKEVFQAKETALHNMEDGSIMHAEIQVNGCTIMFGQGSEQWAEQTSGFFSLHR